MQKKQGLVLDKPFLICYSKTKLYIHEEVFPGMDIYTII